jgi:hypothetical protein
VNGLGRQIDRGFCCGFGRARRSAILLEICCQRRSVLFAFQEFASVVEIEIGYMKEIVVDVLQSGIGNEIVVPEIGCGIVFGLGSENAIVFGFLAGDRGTARPSIDDQKRFVHQDRE